MNKICLIAVISAVLSICTVSLSASPKLLDTDELKEVIGKGSCEMCANQCSQGGTKSECRADTDCYSYVQCPGGWFENDVWAGDCVSILMDVDCSRDNNPDTVDCGTGFQCICDFGPVVIDGRTVYQYHCIPMQYIDLVLSNYCEY